MKKYFSLILVLILAFAMASSAFAADSVVGKENGTGSSSENVTADYKKEETNAGNVDKVYHVTVAWDVKSTIVYSEGTTTFTWNADDTKYEATTKDKGWDGTATVNVTVTNKSNDDITATTAWKAAEDITVDATIDQPSIDIDSAAKGVEVKDKEAGSAKEGTVEVAVKTPTAGAIAAKDAVIGTVTVTIAPKTVQP